MSVPGEFELWIFRVINLSVFLRIPRRLRFTGSDRGSRHSQIMLNPRCERVRGTEDASCNASSVLECLNGLAEIVERGGGVAEERPSVIQPNPKRCYIILAESASRHGHAFAEQRLRFCVAL